MSNANPQNKKGNGRAHYRGCLEIQATDKGSKSDLTARTKSGGHHMVEQTEEDGVFTFWIEKA